MKKVWNTILVVLLSAFCGVFAYFCLAYYESGFIANNFAWLIAVCFVIIAAAATASLIFLFNAEKKPIFETLFKTILSGYFLVAILLTVFFIMQKTGFLELVQDPERYKQYLETSGEWMVAVYILLQYLQVVLLPIPTFVSTAAGVALFGPVKAMFYSLIGVTLGSFTGFFIGRVLGEKAAAWMVGKETLEKWQEKLKGKDNLVLTAMFLLPVFPDDVLCFIAGLSSMSNLYFAVMIIVSRIIGISTTCFSVGFIPFDTWWGILIWIGLAAIVITVFIVLYKNVDKLSAWIEKVFGTKNQKRQKKDKKNRE